MRLYRCRNLTQAYATGNGTPQDADSMKSYLGGLDEKTKFKLAHEHFAHRLRSVEHQLSAYTRWEQISAKPPHERTPGEEHYILCMAEWEKRYQPLLPSPDYDRDAGLMLFDMNMAYHDDAAQALIALEEARRLREEQLLKECVGPGAAGHQSAFLAKPPRSTSTTRSAPNPPTTEHKSKKKRSLDAVDSDDSWGHNEQAVARPPVSKRKIINHAADTPERGAEKIESNAEL